MLFLRSAVITVEIYLAPHRPGTPPCTPPKRAESPKQRSPQRMVLPILAGLGLITAIGTGRAAFRAWTRLRAMPPSAFGVVDYGATKAGADTRFLPGGFQSEMTHAEALEILGLQPGATKHSITQQHRRIMLANHPDKGGSNYFALKINEAKDVLMRSSR